MFDGVTEINYSLFDGVFACVCVYMLLESVVIAVLPALRGKCLGIHKHEGAVCDCAFRCV